MPLVTCSQARQVVLEVERITRIRFVTPPRVLITRHWRRRSGPLPSVDARTLHRLLTRHIRLYLNPLAPPIPKAHKEWFEYCRASHLYLRKVMQPLIQTYESPKW